MVIHIEKSHNIRMDQHVIIEKQIMEPEDYESKPEQNRKKQKKLKRKLPNTTTDNSNTESVQGPSQVIDRNDLEELVSVYRRCKAVVKKIEKKYGHLLDLDSEASEQNVSYKEKKRKRSEEETHKCECEANQKIVFDDMGNHSVQTISMPEHICVPKSKNKHKISQETHSGIEIEYQSIDTLPDDFISLHNILKDTNIDVNYRNKVIKKINTLRREYKGELRYEKPSLFLQLKSDPKMLMDFEGSNLFELPGYIEE